MGKRNKLRAVDALEVKRLLWEGTPQVDIAVKFGVSQATISRIQNGQAWMEVRWPDNSHGSLSAKREAEIWQQRFPGQAIKGVVLQAMDRGMDLQEVARRVSQEAEKQEEEEDDEIRRNLTIVEEKEK